MCGIIAIVRKRSNRPVPTAEHILGEIRRGLTLLPALSPDGMAQSLDATAEALDAVDHELRGESGLVCLLNHAELADHIVELMAKGQAEVAELERYLEAEGNHLDDLESINHSLISVKDALWAIERDRLRTAQEVADLAGPDPSTAAIASFLSVQQALSALDRLEVRGRDSAGLHLLVRDHGLDLDSPELVELLAGRVNDGLFTHEAVRTPNGHLSFVYKAAAEIGELGDNTAAMRSAISSDALLRVALKAETAETTVLGHTRWASVGIISEPNAHPVNSDETGGISGPYITATLNGDVDNFADLIAADGLCLAPEITTDAKVIPTLISRGLAVGVDLDESVRRAVATFEGSVAIGISSAESPADVHLALRGSGQGVFLGVAEDAFVVASEPYGVVEDATTYLRMDGETPSDPDNPSTSQGQIIRLNGDLAGNVEGVTRFSYDGTVLPVSRSEWKLPEVTTRDIDRGDAPHYLLKEITESPNSFRKTLRGRLVEVDDVLEVDLTVETISPEVSEQIRSGQFKRVLVIGQGTAAVAGQGVAAAFEWTFGGTDVQVQPITATELSGFGVRPDMSDTLVVAISQSGTTTDTNRTVDIVRARGAVVLAIVNRRGSDLVDKSDGVLYTSDGRDVEMSVASTKAFYAQIAAGFLLAVAVGDLAPGTSVSERDRQAVLSCASRPARRHEPDAWETDRDWRRGPTPCSEPPLLGDGRQRAESGRSPGSSNQAVRALLQVHRR